MPHQLYTAAGCARCKITKRYLAEHAIPFEEYDFKGAGQEAFARFYRTNRSSIRRGPDGVEFPVFSDGKAIRQGVSAVIGYLITGDALSGFIKPSALHGEWIDGIEISGGNPAHSAELLQVLAYLKKSGLKIQALTDCRNAAVLQAIHGQDLVDKLLVEVRGPAALYHRLCGHSLEASELKHALALAARFGERQFFTTIAPLIRKDGSAGFLSPEEIAATSQLLEAATGTKRNAYELRYLDPRNADDENLRAVEPLPSAALFKYRTAARRYQVLTEIAK